MASSSIDSRFTREKKTELTLGILFIYKIYSLSIICIRCVCVHMILNNRC